MTSDLSLNDLERMRVLLCSLQDHLLESLIHARRQDSNSALAGVDRQGEDDTIYNVDRVTEEAIAEWFTANWPQDLPVRLIMEGLAEDQPWCFPKGIRPSDARWIAILDPIDGTRNFMHDKRSAWALAGIAPVTASTPRLSDIVVAAMTELPASNAWRADQISCVRGGGLHSESINVLSGQRSALKISPSSASDCRHGFAWLVRFFPDGMEMTAAIEERLWNRLYPEARGGSPLVFTDQYLTTGGQLYELMIGRDRFIGDIRPLVFTAIGIPTSLCCHPYDLAAMLLATEAGVLIEDPMTGATVDAPLDTLTPVAWCGYANQVIAAPIRPVLRELIRNAIPAPFLNY